MLGVMIRGSVVVLPTANLMLKTVAPNRLSWPLNELKPNSARQSIGRVTMTVASAQQGYMVMMTMLA